MGLGWCMVFLVNILIGIVVFVVLYCIILCCLGDWVVIVDLFGVVIVVVVFVFLVLFLNYG